MSNKVVLMVLVILLIADIMTGMFSVVGQPSPPNIANKSTGGCAFGCNKSLAFGNNYCSGLTTGPITTSSTSPVLVMSGVLTSTNVNITNGFIEVQMDLGTDLANNVYGALGKCSNNVVLELGLVQFYPVLNTAFSTSLSGVFPFTAIPVVQGVTYFGSISIRYFAGANGTGTMNWRINSAGSNAIALNEVTV